MLGTLLDGAVMLFDFGPGCYHRMMEAGVRAVDVTHVFFTHLHYDHCLDYVRLLMTRWDQGGGGIPELEVFGPTHTARMTDAIIAPLSSVCSCISTDTSEPVMLVTRVSIDSRHSSEACRPAPELVSKQMVETMKAGSIIVDLAVERGGNCPLSKPDKTVTHKGVKIIGTLNLAGHLAGNASQLYAKNLLNFLELMIDKDTGQIAIDWDDEIITGTALTRDGKIIHPALT